MSVDSFASARNDGGYCSHDDDKSAIDIGRIAAAIGTFAHGAIGGFLFFLLGPNKLCSEIYNTTTVWTKLNRRVVLGAESRNGSGRGDFGR